MVRETRNSCVTYSAGFGKEFAYYAQYWFRCANSEIPMLGARPTVEVQSFSTTGRPSRRSEQDFSLNMVRILNFARNKSERTTTVQPNVFWSTSRALTSAALSTTFLTRN